MHRWAIKILEIWLKITITNFWEKSENFLYKQFSIKFSMSKTQIIFITLESRSTFYIINFELIIHRLFVPLQKRLDFILVFEILQIH